MPSTPRAIFLVLVGTLVAAAALWGLATRSRGALDELVSRAASRPRTAVVGDPAVRIGLASLELAPPDALAAELDGEDEGALLEAMGRAGVGAIIATRAPSPAPGEPHTMSLRARLRRYEALDALACLYLTPEAALYAPRTELVLEPILADSLAHVARAVVGGAAVPRVQSFPEPLRRIRNVEVMVLLSDVDRPRLWRSARGSSVARALLTASTVARQRWMEREAAMGGPLTRVLPTLDVAVHILEEDGTLGARAHAFVEASFGPEHGVAFEHRGNWHYLLPEATRERGDGSAVRAYAALFSDQDMPAESLDRPDVRLYRSVARRVAMSPAPSRSPGSVVPPSAHAPDPSAEGLGSLAPSL